MKIFLDANILIAAAGSESGGSRYLFKIAAHDSSWQLLTSAYALAEARSNILAKLPGANKVFAELITNPALTIIHPPSDIIIGLTHGLVPTKDQPILAAAISCAAAALCTLDKKDFHTPKLKHQCKKWHLKIVTPKDLLTAWRAKQTDK